jgi:hypothetical protein
MKTQVAHQTTGSANLPSHVFYIKPLKVNLLQKHPFYFCDRPNKNTSFDGSSCPCMELILTSIHNFVLILSYFLGLLSERDCLEKNWNLSFINW